jgi:protein-S-isoprenylcysteine O-methyltransferase Ste14
LLAALLGGIVACVTGLASGKRLHVIAGIPLVALSIGTLLGVISRSYAWRPFAAAPPWPEQVYRWQNMIQLALVAVVFITPPMAEEAPLLDLACDVFGATGVVAGALLRLGAAAHPEEQRPFAQRLPTRIVTDGAYACMRQPLALSTLLIGVGLVLLAESGPGLLLVPVALIMMYRITIPLEEACLVARFGQAYVDYCASVPRFPRATAPMLAAASAVLLPGSPRWRSIRQELPALATTLALTVLAEVHEFLPHALG